MKKREQNNTLKTKKQKVQKSVWISPRQKNQTDRAPKAENYPKNVIEIKKS